MSSLSVLDPMRFRPASQTAMRRFIWLLFVLAALPSGLSQAAPGPDTSAEGQIRHRVSEICDAVAKKDLARLDTYHLYGPKFSKFAEAGGRQDAEAARQGEHQGLSALEAVALEPEDMKIDVFGNAGVATMILKATVKAGDNSRERRSRGTLVFVKDNGSWKIVHEHFSSPATATANGPMPQPKR